MPWCVSSLVSRLRWCLLLRSAGAVYAQNKPLKKIRVGVPSVGMGNIIIFVTKEGKLFEKYGLDAEVITVMGSGIGSKALISGNLDIIPIATPTVIAANLAGADMAILGAHHARRGSCLDGAARYQKSRRI